MSVNAEPAAEAGTIALASVDSRISVERTTFSILLAISCSHLLNDMIQSLIPALYPILKDSFALNFTEIGLITLCFQVTASLLQPLVGLYTDKRPLPYSLAVGMGSTLIGLLVLSIASSYAMLLGAVALVGLGSAVFHPESSRVARMASGGRHGMAQSVFQVGGNIGSSLGPVCAAFIVLPYGQHSIAYFSIFALLAILILWNVGRWYGAHRPARKTTATKVLGPVLPRHKVQVAIAVLVALMFSKFVYLSSLSSYLTFYLIDRFHVSTQEAQVYLFVYLAAVAAGTVVGGPIGDRFGRKYVIWFSILGIFPFSVALPYVNLFWTCALTMVIGMILASAFSAIIVFAQELVPGNIGAISGLFFGLAFGMGGLGAALLGRVADATSIEFVYRLCSFLPLIGLLAIFLPNMPRAKSA